MNPVALRRALEGTIRKDWDDGRDYLGMSQIGQCPKKLYNDLVYGRWRLRGLGIRLCHEGKIHEADLIDRLGQAELSIVNAGRELVASFDERFRGHIDGELDGDLIEFKSLSDDAALDDVRRRGARLRHQYQVQAYMRYGDYDRALIVYKTRGTGDLWVVELERDNVLGAMIERKAQRVLDCVDHETPPDCECGRCR